MLKDLICSFKNQKLFFCFFFLILIQSSYALDSTEIEGLAKGSEESSSTDALKDLPAATDQSKLMFINSSNVKKFYNFLLQPMAEWIEKGNLSLRAVGDLKYSWKNVFNDKGKALKLGALPNDVKLLNEQESPIKKAKLILENMQSAQVFAPNVKYELLISWLGKDKLLRKGETSLFQKRFKKSESDKFSLKQYFKFLNPSVIFGLTHIVWEGLNSEDSRFWIYSPVIGRSREVLESNLGDSFLGGMFSEDDLFGFFRSLNSVSFKFLGEKTLLAPFPSLGSNKLLPPTKKSKNSSKQFPRSANFENLKNIRELPPLGASIKNENSKVISASANQRGDAYVVESAKRRLDSSSTFAFFDYQGQKRVDLSPWVSVSSSFIPRKFYVVGVWPKDPFWPNGKEILFIDQQSFLPTYKLIYDRKGDFKQLVITSYGLASMEKDEVDFPFWAYTQIIDKGGINSVVISTSEVSIISPNSAKEKDEVAKLDIKSHEPQKSEAAPNP